MRNGQKVDKKTNEKNFEFFLDIGLEKRYTNFKFNCKTVEREIKPVTDSKRACGGGIQAVNGPDKWTLEVCGERFLPSICRRVLAL